MPKPIQDIQDRIDYSRALIDRFENDLDALAARLTGNEISLGEWQVEMRAALRQEHALQLITAAGGDVANVDPNDWLRLGTVLQQQYGYLEDFAHEIAANDYSLEYIANRAGLYANKTQVSFWLQHTKEADLPEVPGENCKGLGLCGCSWVNRDGLWYWELGDKDHCTVCLDNAAKYNPYTAE